MNWYLLLFLACLSVLSFLHGNALNHRMQVDLLHAMNPEARVQAYRKQSTVNTVKFFFISGTGALFGSAQAPSHEIWHGVWCSLLAIFVFAVFVTLGLGFSDLSDRRREQNS